MADVDNLSIKISAEAQSAISSLDSLNSKLDTLSSKLKGISTGSLSTLSKGVKELAQATKELNSVKISNLGKITGSLEKLGQIDVGNLAGTATAMTDFASAMTSLSGITIDANQIKDLAKALKGFENLSLGNIATDLPNVASAISSLSGLSINATQISELSKALKEIGAVKVSNLDQIAQGLSQLSAIDGSNFSQVVSSISSLAMALNAISGVSINTKQIEKLGIALKAFENLNLQNVVNDLPSVASAIASLSGFIIDPKQITALAKALEKLNVVDFSGAARDLPDLATALQTFMTNIQGAPEVSGNVMQLARALGELGNKSFQDAINDLPDLATELDKVMQTLSKAPKVSQNTATLVSALAAFGGKNFQNAITQLPRLGAALKNVIDILSRVPRVSRNVTQLVTALSRFNGTGRQVGSTANTISSGFNRISSSSVKLVTPIKNIEKAIRGVVRHFLSLATVIAGIKKSIEIASALTEVQNVVDVTFGDMSSKVQEFADTSIEQFGMSELSVKKFASQFQAMGTAMGINSGLIDKANSFLHEQDAEYIGLSDSLSDVSLNLTKLTADIASFYDVAQSDVAEDLASIFTGQTRPLRDYGLDLTQATLSEWALKNGLDANIQSMSQAEKTMLRYQYVIANTAAAHGDFARTQMTWANQIRILKQNFEQLGAVIGNVLINVLKPFVVALNTAMGYVIKFAKVVSNALGAIFGWTYEESGTGGIAQDFGVAADAADDMASGTGKTAKNIEKMQKGLRAFDELKVINLPEATEPSGGGGAGGGAGGAGAGDVGGGWKPGESIWKEYTSDIDNLKELGEYIGKTLTDAMNNIPWESIYEKARGFGKGLADFLNGLISPELFGALGRTIAGALNTALYVLYELGDKFEWENLGESIATGINEFFKMYDFSTLGQTINIWVLGILKSIITAIQQTEWTVIGQKIGELLANINFLEILQYIGIAIWEAINGAVEMFIGMFSVAPFETAILGILALPALVTFGSKIITFIATPFLNVWKLVQPVLANLYILISSMSAPVLALAAAFAVLVGGLAYVFATNEQVRESFFNAVGVIADSLQPAIEYISQTVIPDLNNAWNGLIEILTPFGEFLEMVFTSIWQDMINPALTTIGTVVLPVLIETFQNLWENVLVPLGEFIGNILTPIFQVVSDVLTMLWQNVVVPLAKAIGGIFIEAFKGVAEIINKIVIPIVKNLISVLNTLWKNVLSPIVNFLKNTFKPVFENVFKGIKGLIENLQKAFSGLIKFITGVFTGDWKRAWEGVKDVFKGVLNGLISVAQGVANGVIGGINAVIRSLNSLSFTVPDWVPAIGGSSFGFNIGELSTVSIPRLAKGGIVTDYTQLIAGEAGAEAILPLTDRGSMRMIADSILDGIDSGSGYGYSPADFEQAAYKGFKRAMDDYQRSEGNSPEIRVFIGDREITDIVIDGIDERTRRTGRTPFAMA